MVFTIFNNLLGILSMKKSEIQQKLNDLAHHINRDSFIFDFLTCFGLSKTTIARLRKGDYNLSKIDGELFYKGKIFFKVGDANKLMNTIDELSKDEKILKQKPRFIVLTDFETVFATDTKLKTNKEFYIEELDDQVDFFLPLSGAEIYRVSSNDKADRDAAYKLGELYDLLVIDNPEWGDDRSHLLNLFLSRLLFCYFAEDTGIFPTKSVFTEALANNTKVDGSDIDEFLSLLFKKLNCELSKDKFPNYLSDFPYVNGGLFRDDITCPRFSKKSRQILLDSGELDWSEINPDIFGSMIQAVADPSERTNLGMHYTSVQNILKLIKPLFLDQLYEDFEKHKDNAKALEKLLLRMSKIKFFDPACGSGNFLIITYKELRGLEIQIIKQLVDLNQAQSKIYFTAISLTQFYGIEIKDFAHEMAILSLWLAEHQMNQVFDAELLDYGRSKPILPLKEAGNITQGNAARISWKEVCPIMNDDETYIIGNPPYLGARLQNEVQKEDITLNLRGIKGGNNLDYIFIWFYKGAQYIQGTNSKLAFVSTNSVCQGEQVSLLWPSILSNGIEIDFAYQSFKWINNAKGNAGVIVIIIGLRNNSKSPKFIFTDGVARSVNNVNAYLLDSNDIYVKPRSKSLAGLPEISFGSMPNDGGGLILNENEYNLFRDTVTNAKTFLKNFIGADEFLKGTKRYCLWFDENNFQEFQNIEEIKVRFEKVIYHRESSSRVATRKLSNIFYSFGEVRHKCGDSIIIPRHSSIKRDYIPLGFFNSDTVIADSAMAIYDAESWLFGLLHSKMHMVWVNAVGGKIKNDYRYSAKLCYNTFPFPRISTKQKEMITQYVFDILDERAKYSEKTMSWMYNPETMPSGLKSAHNALDLAVERIYRLATFNSDEERLEYLFKLYNEMNSRNTLFAKVKKTRTIKV